MTFDSIVEKIMNACRTNKERCAKAYFIRLFAPWLFLIPLIYFGFTTGAVVATVFAFLIGRRIIETHFHNEFAAMYSLRHFNLQNRKANKNG